MHSMETLMIGSAVTALPNRGGLRGAIAWHSQRAAALRDQLKRTRVRMGDPRRHAEMKLALEHHETTVAQLRQNITPPPRRDPSMTATRRSFAERQAERHDRAMQSDWREQLTIVGTVLEVA